MNHSQRNLKKLIRAKEDSIADEELFLSAAYQKYQTSLARAVTGRYRYGLQVLLDWDISEQAGVAYTDNYKVLNVKCILTFAFTNLIQFSRIGTTLVTNDNHRTNFPCNISCLCLTFFRGITNSIFNGNIVTLFVDNFN